jgi:hypothetical protein
MIPLDVAIKRLKEQRDVISLFFQGVGPSMREGRLSSS